MKFQLNFEECLKDSPRFRSSLSSCETDIDHLELRLERVVRLCANMVDAGKHFSQSNGMFIAGLVDLADHFGSGEDFLLKSNLTRFADLLREVQNYFNILLEQAHRSICKNLHELVKEDIRKVREAKKSFEKMGGDLDQALTRNAAASRIKGAECEESTNYLTAVRGCFSHTAMDYVYQIGLLQGRQRFVVLDTILSFIHAESTFFHQGTDSFQDVEADLKMAAANLETFSTDMTTRQKLMEERHDLVQKRESTLKAESNLITGSAVFNGIGPTIVSETEEANLAAIEGYLFKRTTNAFKTWNRRWFMLKDNQLIYCKRETGAQESGSQGRNSGSMKSLTSGTQSASSSPYPRHRDGLNTMSASFMGALPSSASSSVSGLQASFNFTVMEPDLRLCSAKPLIEGVDRRFCFEVVSPSARHVLQADSDSECVRWISAIHHGISQAYRCAADNSASTNSKTNSLSNSVYGGASLNVVDVNGRSSARNSPARTKKIIAGTPDCSGGDNGGEIVPATSALTTLIAIPGNEKCCDCGLADPRWASINLGITLCIECSGIHRSLGVHLSKVRSLNLDAWEPESMKVMSELGNDVINSIYLSSLSDSHSVSSTSSRQEKEAWIKAKYVERLFLAPLPQQLSNGVAKDVLQNAKDSPHSPSLSPPQSEQQHKLPNLPPNAFRWLVSPMPKKRNSKPTINVNNNINGSGRSQSTPLTLASASSSPRSSPRARLSPKQSTPVDSHTPDSSATIEAAPPPPPPPAYADPPSESSTEPCVCASSAPLSSSPLSFSSAVTSPSPSAESRLPSPMDISASPTEEEKDCRKSDPSVGEESIGCISAVESMSVTTFSVEKAAVPTLDSSSSSKEQTEKKNCVPDEKKMSIIDNNRLSLRRSVPALDNREQVLVFDGVGLWKIKYFVGDDSKGESDPNNGSTETGSLGASSSSPSLSSTASGDPLREDVLDDLTVFSPNLLLFRAARQRNLRVMCLAFAHRAMANCAPNSSDGRSPLMEAVASGSIAACEYLLLNGAKLDAVDATGRRTALHHATILGHTGQVCQFLKRGANQGALDINDLDAISIAINAANADIVTLLRLAKLNEEIKESELGNPGDATFSEVFKDFSNMAVEDPDQLNNRYQLLSQDEDPI